MMRKTLFIFVFLLIPLLAAQAQETPRQSPIFAIANNKLYAVSAEDGQATLLVEPNEPEQFISQLRPGSLSPDNQQLVYTVQGTLDTPLDQFKSSLFVLNIANRTIENITPSGGIFDVPARGQIVQINMPTWSYDGQRIYYIRAQYDVSAKQEYTLVQFAYYDIAAQSHHLVSRIDPRLLLDYIQAVPSGIILRWYEPGFNGATTSSFYDVNNQIVNRVELASPFLYALNDQDEVFYAQLRDFGDIDFMVNARTGETDTTKQAQFPAARSVSADDVSMHVYNVFSNTSSYSVYGADYNTYITTFEDTFGFNYGIAPDGQSLAFLKFEGDQLAPITILDMQGSMHELDFLAQQIIWGPTEFVPFLSPG